MLTIPSDMNVTDTSEAQAMKLTSKRMREKEGVRPGADSMAQIAADMDKVADAYLTLTEVPARGVGGEFVQQTGDKSSVVCPPRKK